MMQGGVAWLYEHPGPKRPQMTCWHYFPQGCGPEYMLFAGVYDGNLNAHSQTAYIPGSGILAEVIASTSYEVLFGSGMLIEPGDPSLHHILYFIFAQPVPRVAKFHFRYRF